jgi:hypothetical protein
MAVVTVSPGTADSNQIKSKIFNINLAQVANTYDLLTASSGSVDILGIEFYNDVAGSGLTSVTVQTNDTTVTTVLATVLLATLTGGKNLTALATSLILPSGKKITYTIIGTGSAGSIKAHVRYMTPTSGADIN